MVPTRQLILLLLGAAPLACLSDFEEPSGRCSGEVGAVSVSDDIDRRSEFHFVYDDDCGTRDIINLAYGDDTFAVHVETSERLTVASSEGDHPIPPMAEADLITVFSVTSPSGAPAIDEGFISIDRGLDSRLRGSLQVVFTDDTEVDCSYDLPFDGSLNEDEPLTCR